MARLRRPPVSPRRGRGGKQRVANSPASSLKRPTRSKKGLLTSSSSPVASRATLAKKLAHKTVATPLVDSDDSDRLVTKKANEQTPNWKGHRRTEIYASGGVAKGDRIGAHPSRKRKRQDGEEANAIKRSQRMSSSATSQATTRSPLAPLSSQQAANTSSVALASSPAIPASSRPRSAMPNRFQGTPGCEVSILGGLNPRKRQPSILQLIDRNNNSSSLGLEDENDFLPDDESSTPLHASKTTAATSTPGLPLLQSKDVTSSSGLYRPANKRDGSLLSAAIEVVSSQIEPKPELPPQLQQRLIGLLKRSRTVESSDANADVDSVMAPPQSSSSPSNSPYPESTQKKSTSRTGTRKPAPTTASLQALMPSKIRRTKRQHSTRPGTSEFDIPEDSGESQNHSQSQFDGLQQQQEEEEEEGSAFLPSQRRKKGGRKTQLPAKAKAKARAKAKNVVGAVTRRQGGASMESGGARHLNIDTTESGDGDGDDEGNKENWGAELPRKMADKWAKIDEWEMEFEEVSLGGSSPEKR